MILCCGEALIDMFARKADDGTTSFAPHPGGSVFNTAITIGRLGERAGFFSGLSNDLFGQMLRQKLEESQVDTAWSCGCERPTTLAFVTLDNGQADYVFYDENTAGRMIRTADLPVIDDTVAALFFGGISLAAEPCGSAYEQLMLRESARRVTMIDPNIRPAFIADRKAHESRIERMIARADVVKISHEDLQWFDGARNPGATVRKWLRHGSDEGAHLVVITDGGRGATAYFSDEVVSVPAHPVQPVDTVGAGDTFNGAMLVAMRRAGLLDKERLSTLEKDTVVAIMTFAAQAAAVTVSRAGANPPWRHEMR